MPPWWLIYGGDDDFLAEYSPEQVRELMKSLSPYGPPVKGIVYLTGTSGGEGTDRVKDMFCNPERYGFKDFHEEHGFFVPAYQKSFRCQREYEDETKCDDQCTHCAEYYKDIEE